MYTALIKFRIKIATAFKLWIHEEMPALAKMDYKHLTKAKATTYFKPRPKDRGDIMMQICLKCFLHYAQC